jgi:PII-like signaling protein
VNTVVLRIYMHENRRHHGLLLYDWLLEQARRRLHIHGGSAFRAVAGYGRHGVLHEQHFFELAGELPVVVEFVVTQEESERLLAAVRGEGLDVVYTRWAAEFAATGARSVDRSAPDRV